MAVRRPSHRAGAGGGRPARSPGAGRARTAPLPGRSACAREAAVWLLIALASAALLVASFQQHHREAEPELRRAGAAVATAVVARAPSGVHPHTSEGRVQGWTSRLELTVPGSAETVRASAYTYEEPKAGDRVLLLYAPSRPALEGRVDARKDLRSVAAGSGTGPGSWDPFPQADEARKALLPAARLLALALHLRALYGHPHPVAGALAWVSCLLPALGRAAAYAAVRGLP
ncbi:hypothetical protein ACE1OC_27695 [Streptomyces sp. DSM 116496]|uniref:hypothetical protein n=1 Tax=Streptomyces stoeckheimensis TaxID=3344656 RepID=UPI0038B40335